MSKYHGYIWERSVASAIKAADFIESHYETEEAEVVNFSHASEDRVFVYYVAKSQNSANQIAAEWRRIQKGTSTRFPA